MGGLALVAAGVVAALLLFRSDPGSAEPRGPMPLGDHQPCTDQVVLYVKTDEDMTRVSIALADDAQIKKIYTETSQQTNERYRRIFADQPDILKLYKDGVLGATIHVTPAADVGARALADQLRTRFTEARRVDPILHDETPPGMTERPPACPPSGEWD